MARDLSGRPLRGSTRDQDLFVDREAEIARVRTAIERGSNVLLLGERGAGKTSLLYRVESALERASVNALILDGRAAYSTHDLLTLIRERFQAVGTLPLDTGPRTQRMVTSESGALLLDDLRLLREALPPLERNVLLLDEAPSPSDARTLFGRLRDELWELPLTWCVAGNTADRAAFTSPPADAFWSYVVELTPLTEADAAELLTRRLPDSSLAGNELDTIVREARGNPRRLISLARAATEGLSAHEISQMTKRTRDAASILGPSAQKLLADLEANGPTSASDEGLLRRMGWSRGRAAQVLRQLEEAGLLTVSDSRTGSSRPKRLYALRTHG